MSTREDLMNVARLLAAGALGLTFSFVLDLCAQAAEVRVIGSSGVASVVNALGRQFEAATGHKVQADYAVVAVSKRKIDAGAAFDLAILSPQAIDALIGQGKIAPDTRSDFGRTG